jgi:hypothetical protein
METKTPIPEAAAPPTEEMLLMVPIEEVGTDDYQKHSKTVENTGRNFLSTHAAPSSTTAF